MTTSSRSLLTVACVFFLQFFCFNVLAGEVALTIDDLPYVGSAGQHEGKLNREKTRFNIVLDTLKAEHVPAAGFVVARYIEKGQWELLENFKNAGNIIANHTYSHINLNSSSAEKFINNIDRADKILEPILTSPKYFRYPFLATGRTCKTKAAVRQYLHDHHYVIAPVTIDSKDFKFNQQYYSIPWRERPSRLNYFRKTYLSYISKQIDRAEKHAMATEGRPIKHIFLIHMNTLNSHFMKDVIDLFRNRGYRFVSLPEAMKDPYYKEREEKEERMIRQCALG